MHRRVLEATSGQGVCVKDKRYSLSIWDLGAVFAGLGVLAALNLMQLLPQTEDVVSGVPEDTALHDRAMRGDMLWAYERWDRRDDALAVFARGSTAFGWVDGYLDEAVAQADALAWCREHGNDCEVIEVRRALVAVPGLEMPLNENLAGLVTRVRATPGPAALAVSGTGAYAAARGITVQDAAERALEQCGLEAARDRPSFLPTHPCRVILQR